MSRLHDSRQCVIRCLKLHSHDVMDPQTNLSCIQLLLIMYFVTAPSNATYTEDNTKEVLSAYTWSTVVLINLSLTLTAVPLAIVSTHPE